MHHGNVHTAKREAVGGFQAEQAAADHHRMPVSPGSGDHRVDVGDVAKADHAGQVGPGDGQDEGTGAGRQEQAVVLRTTAILGFHETLLALDLHHALAGMQGDAALCIPVARIQDDLIQRLFAGQHRREHDAVVIGMRLITEDGDVVEIGRGFQQLLQGAHPGHAVAHEYQFHACHV